MKLKSIICIVVISVVVILMSGCGRDHFFDYDCNWQCDNPYIYIDVQHYKFTYTENGEEKSVYISWTINGSSIFFLDDSHAATKTIKTVVKDGKLHIYNLFKKGDEYVLKQVDKFE